MLVRKALVKDASNIYDLVNSLSTDGTLLSIHNVHFYMEMMAEIREAIGSNRFMEYKGAFLEGYLSGEKRK